MLTVREMTTDDVDLLIHYWLQSDKEHLISMGVDLQKLPGEQELRAGLMQQLQLPIEQKMAYALIWEDHGVPIGHCNVNPIRFGEEANMHLHIWYSHKRRKGIGTALVKASLPYFFRHLKINTLYCEPYALNPAPNKTLKRLGFERVKNYTTIPGSINFEQEVTQWKMTRAAYDALYS